MLLGLLRKFGLFSLGLFLGAKEFTSEEKLENSATKGSKL